MVNTIADGVNGTAEAFKAGESIGECLDNCNGVQLADAVSEDLQNTSKLLLMAAGAVGMVAASGNAQEDNQGQDQAEKPDIRRTTAEKHGDAEGAQEQLESLEHDQQRKLKAGARNAPDSTEKSKQNLKKKLKDIKSSEDAKIPD